MSPAKVRAPRPPLRAQRVLLCLFCGVGLAGTVRAELMDHLNAELGHLFATPIGQRLDEIKDHPAPAQLSVRDTEVREGDEGVTKLTFIVTLSRLVNHEVRVDYFTRGGTAQGGNDFSMTSGTLLFPPGETTMPVTVEVQGDTFIEPDEHFYLLLNNPQGAELASSQARGILLNDDLPALTIGNVEQPEGAGEGEMRFRLTLSEAAYGITRVDYATVDGTALAGSDYEAGSGTLEFAVAQTEQELVVKTLGDGQIEADEQFAIVLRNPYQLRLATDNAVGTLLNDDYPDFRVNALTLPEGNQGYHPVYFTLDFSAPSLTELHIDYQTQDGTARAGEDYREVRGLLTVPPGTLQERIEVQVNGDRRIEHDEHFTLELRGDFPGGHLSIPATLRNDDLPRLGIDDLRVEEGSDADLVLRLSEPFHTPITLDYATENLTAQALSDYEPLSGSLTFAPGEVEKHLTLHLLDDDIPEGREQLSLHLTPQSDQVVLLRDSALITIDDQDRVVAGHSGKGGLVRLGADGQVLGGEPDFATNPWHCVQDQLTGLTWEVKQPDAGLHDRNALFSYYQAGKRPFGLAAGGRCSAPEGCDTGALVSAVNSAGWCGHADWRLPSRDELASLLLPATAYPLPTIDSAYFPNTQSGWYWAAAEQSTRDLHLWSVDFAGGNQALGRSVATAQYVRLVRGPR